MAIGAGATSDDEKGWRAKEMDVRATRRKANAKAEGLTEKAEMTWENGSVDSLGR